MKRLIIRYALYGSSVSIALGLLNWFVLAPISVGLSQAVGYLSIIASLFCIPLGLKYFRDKLNSGSLTFKEGFRIGMGITLVASAILFLYSLLFFVIAGSDFTEWREAGMTAEGQAEMTNMPDYIMSPLFQAVIMFVTVFLIGFIINLISIFVLKSNPIQAQQP